MINNKRRLLLQAGLALPALSLLPQAWAEENYPARPIRLIHGFGAGGNADVVARLISKQLAQSLGQPVVVEIKSGAGGRIASDSVAKARPDGYTLVMLTGAHTVSAAVSKELSYDPVKDFSFLSTVSKFPFVLAVRADHPAKNLAELLAMARKSPGKITFTSVGVGSTQHMTGELLATEGKVELLHIPYRGGGAPVEAVLSGEVDVLSDTLTVASPQLKAGKLRALAITSATPWPQAPDIAPAAQTLPGFEVLSWLGMAAPAALPEPIVTRLNTAIAQALQDPELQQALATVGSQAAPGSPAEMRTMVASEILRWKTVAKTAGIPPL